MYARFSIVCLIILKLDYWNSRLLRCRTARGPVSGYYWVESPGWGIVSTVFLKKDDTSEYIKERYKDSVSLRYMNNIFFKVASGGLYRGKYLGCENRLK